MADRIFFTHIFFYDKWTYALVTAQMLMDLPHDIIANPDTNQTNSLVVVQPTPRKPSSTPNSEMPATHPTPVQHITTESLQTANTTQSTTPLQPEATSTPATNPTPPQTTPVLTATMKTIDTPVFSRSTQPTSLNLAPYSTGDAVLAKARRKVHAILALDDGTYTTDHFRLQTVTAVNINNTYSSSRSHAFGTNIMAQLRYACHRNDAFSTLRRHRWISTFRALHQHEHYELQHLH
jgi:hypothetical protein